MSAIGITGGISTGKSTFSDCLREILPGAKFFDADEVARQLVADLVRATDQMVVALAAIPWPTGVRDPMRLFINVLLGNRQAWSDTAHVSYDVDFWLDVVATARPGRVLELACGTGRVTLPLAAAGIEIVGIDIDPVMLVAARARSSAEAGRRPVLVAADMRRFALAANVDGQRRIKAARGTAPD